jgi:SAM-dependent methyltransferase
MHNDEMLERIRTALLETYYKGTWVENNTSAAAANEINDHVRGRFELAQQWFIPWVKRFSNLRNASIIEIGCGTGSITAALCLEGAAVNAYDISPSSLAAARRRLAVMGLDGASFYQSEPMIQLPLPGDSVECVILFAVLEHMKYEERLNALRQSWNALKPGGILVIAEVPNRLIWSDEHTSRLPFFNSLPDDVAIDYAGHSPRQEFADAISSARAVSMDEARDYLTSWGRGVSYHEFQIALGDIAPMIVGDGFDPEPLGHYGVSLETRLLYTYVRRKGLDVPAAFTRDNIEVILRKPGGPHPEPQRRPDEEIDVIVRPLIDT